MRLGGSTFSYIWKGSALDAMRSMRDLGLNDFDVFAVPGHLWAGELSSGQRRQLRRELCEEGIRVESLNLPSLDQNLGSAVPEVRRQAVRFYREALDLACDLECPGVVVVPGRVLGLLPAPLETTIGFVADAVEDLLRLAETNGQTLLIELHPLTPLPRTEALLPFIDRFGGHPGLRVAYDVANAEFVGEDQAAAIRALGGRIGQTHLSDSPRSSWRHDRVGTGSVDFDAVDAALADIGFAGVNIVEIVSDEPERDMASSLRALASLPGGSTDLRRQQA